MTPHRITPEPRCIECRGSLEHSPRDDEHCSDACAAITAREAAADRAHDEWRDAQLDEVA